MKRISKIIILACLVSACIPSDETQPGVPAAAVAAEVVSQAAGQDMEPQDRWPAGEGLQQAIEGFMASGFMRNPARMGFADLAYSDIALDCATDDQGRISQLAGVLSGLYDSYSFEIPVVRHRVDAISGIRQVNWEDVIVQLDEGRWRVQPVSVKAAPPFEVAISDGIEFAGSGTVVRIVKKDSIFTCSEFLVKAGGQEELLVRWETSQYEPGLVHGILSGAKDTAGIPVILSWDPGSIAGYIARLPDGEARFAQRLRWESTGVPETDRYNFLVLLTQCHGEALDMHEKLGSVDPVWLALLMYDHVVNP